MINKQKTNRHDIKINKYIQNIHHNIMFKFEKVHFLNNVIIIEPKDNRPQ
jgi:hypothetical protein